MAAGEAKIGRKSGGAVMQVHCCRGSTWFWFTDCCVICCGLYYGSLSGRRRDGEIGRKGGGPSCNTAQRGICKTPSRLMLHTAGTDWATQNRKKGEGGGARLADACFCKGRMSPKDKSRSKTATRRSPWRWLTAVSAVLGWFCGKRQKTCARISSTRA